MDVPENVPQDLEIRSRNSVFRSSFLALQKHYILLIFINSIVIPGNACWYSFMVDKCIIGREWLDGQCSDVTFKCLNQFSSQDHVHKNILPKHNVCLEMETSCLVCSIAGCRPWSCLPCSIITVPSVFLHPWRTQSSAEMNRTAAMHYKNKTSAL